MVDLGTAGMSRASGLSLKALRLYEANGLLLPASVDDVTGYRRYGEAEVARGRSIRSLRDAGMPLAGVRDLLDAPSDRLRAGLSAWWADERAAFARRGRLVDEVADATARAALDPHAAAEAASRVRVVHRPEQRVASITRVVEQSELVPTGLADVILLRRHLAEQGAAPLDAHQFVFHEPVGSGLPGRVETVVPYVASCDPAVEIVLSVQPATALAAIDVTAPELVYPELLRFYDAVTTAAEHLGGPLGPPREIYEHPWSTAPGAVVVTIAVPVDA
ncbi:DNA-binding transcriptional MerR regulator [Agromyces terreus]|uniref:DNA-binding transcriptional MerR regulator n=1 Tax=Agromyces terreus TaxID=424795 RepID=A0A9X2KAB2_9MICO|nr:MerR family transcriptional regulator [Agromyces terreus]MCP2369369.1 DNA-binding transcriptional MerR regulator [Agromyces terreus]